MRRALPVADDPTRPRLAAVTMVYNEDFFLPLWLRHYAAQVGAANCYVVDHGSDDGSTGALGGATAIRLARSPHDDAGRAVAIARLCAGLLDRYEGVLYTDVDELVLADPACHADLPAFLGASSAPVSHAVGLNVMQMAEEPVLDPGRDPLAQRRYAAFSSALCKPVLIRRPVVWSPGFHCADAPLSFGGLYLFHLRYCDRDQALRRLARTRAMPWADDGAGAHQRVEDGAFLEMFGNFQRMQRRDEVALAIEAAPLADWLRAVRDSQAGREHDTYTIDLQINAYELWPIPARFDGSRAADAPPLVETTLATHR